MTRENAVKGLLDVADWHYGKYEQTHEEDYLNDGDFLTAVANMLKAQEPRLAAESDFDCADESGYIPVWTEEKDGDMYCECITKTAITDSDGIGVFRYWTSRPDQATREATPWN